MSNDFGQISFDDFFGAFGAFETAAPATATATATATTVKAPSSDGKKKAKAIKVEGMTKMVMPSVKEVKIEKDTFSKKTASVGEVVSEFVKRAKLDIPPEVLTATSSTSGVITICYNEESVLSEAAVLPSTFIGYQFVAEEGSQDFRGELTDSLIREGLSGNLVKYKDPVYRFVAFGDSQIFPVPVAGEFEIPFTDKVTVSTKRKGDVVLSFAATVKAKDTEADDEDDEDDESAVLTSGQIAKELGKVLKESCVTVGKLEDGTLIAIPTLRAPSVTTSAKAPEEKKIPITPDLRIYFGYGELPLFGHPALEGKTEITEKEALEILKSTPGRAEFKDITSMIWFESEHYWWPNYPSSRKGSGTPLFSVDKTEVTRNVPLIPKCLVEEILENFREEERTTGNESAAALLFDTRTKTWRASYPTQYATPVSVECNYGEEVEIPYEFVGVQLHSHPNMTISFSSIDDRDERSEGTIYGVFKHRNADSKELDQLCVRIRHEGEFLYVPVSLFFER